MCRTASALKRIGVRQAPQNANKNERLEEENTKLKILLKIGGKKMTAKEKIEQKGQKDQQNSMEIQRENQEKKQIYVFIE